MPQVGRSVVSADITPGIQRQPSIANRACNEERVRIYCGSCGMGTEWVRIEGLDELSALNQCAAVWNKRVNRKPTTAGSLEDLIDKEVGPLDSQYLLSLIANNSEDWPERGPVFARLALRISDAIATSRDFWPVTPVLTDASRYRKLMQQVRFVYVDGRPHLIFPTVPANPDLNDLAFEIRVADAVDNLPDRDRW